MPQSASYIVDYIPILKDNYVWVLRLCHSQSDAQSNEDHLKNGILVVDPGDADAVCTYLEKYNQKLEGILITHGHWDHINGVEQLAALNHLWRDPLSRPIYGHRSIACINTPIANNQTIKPWQYQDIAFKVIATPGHMPEHLSYYNTSHNHANHLSQRNSGALFCGDTLFHSGCGRIFDGTPDQLHASLTTLASLDPQTQIYCTHEYTQANIAFALTIEPNNQTLVAQSQRIRALRDNNTITLPTTLAEQKAINPFLRCHLDCVQDAVAQLSQEPFTSKEDTFAQLRALKDNF